MSGVAKGEEEICRVHEDHGNHERLASIIGAWNPEPGHGCLNRPGTLLACLCGRAHTFDGRNRHHETDGFPYSRTCEFCVSPFGII